MKAIRRIYIYLVSFVSLEVVVWSVIGLGRSAFNRGTIGGGADQLASALAFILVGLPVFLIHWSLAQRDAANEPEELFSGMRALFLYGTWLALFIPVVQNVIAILNRALALFLESDPNWITIGADQTWSDNLVGIVVNGVLAAYFYTVIRANWKETPKGIWFPLIRRIACYLLMLYGFVMVFAGVQQLLSYVFELAGTIGGGDAEILVNGFADQLSFQQGSVAFEADAGLFQFRLGRNQQRLGFHQTVLQEFYQVTFRKKLCADLEGLQADLDEWLMYYNQ